jgi:hypothetical protein
LAGEPPVSFEIATERGLAVTGAHDWHKLLTELGVTDLQIRLAQGADDTSVEVREAAGGKSFHVRGVLAANGTLRLPGGKFSLRDRAALKKWIANLSDQGLEGVTHKPSAFGLLPSQLVQVHDDLQRPVTVATRQQPARDLVRQLRAPLGLKVLVEPEAEQALQELVVEDDLRGLSTGTALAALLRPAGLVLRPERPEGGTLRYRVAKPVRGLESWPVGWVSPEPAARLVPELFESINVEIAETPVAEVVSTVAQRLGLVVLYDHNSLAAKEIDPAAVLATLPQKQLTYSLVLKRVLAQALLEHEVRVDEAGKPLIWIRAR